MNRREFLVTAGAASLRSTFPLGGWAQGEEPPIEHRLPPTEADYQRSRSYIEEVPMRWIIQNLVDVTAKGGNFMVGVGPSGMGSFHPTAIAQLKEAGQWLRINGEGIYGTRPRPGTEWGEGDNVRFASSKDGRILYCFVTEWPGESLLLRSLDSRPVSSVEMFGYPGRLAFRSVPTGNFVISIPGKLQDPSNRRNQFAWGFKLRYAT